MDAFILLALLHTQVAYLDIDTIWLDDAANLWNEVHKMSAKGAYFGMAVEVTEMNGKGSYYKTGEFPSLASSTTNPFHVDSAMLLCFQGER